MSHVKENLKIILNDIKDAAIKANRNPDDICLVAVSKRHSIEDILEAYAAGQRDFGENYGQELRDKAKTLSHLTDIRWHFIGNLQRNKVKYVVPSVSIMECIDSLKIAEAFSKKAVELQRTVEVFLQVNVGEEEQKSGCAKEEATELVKKISALPNINLTGLMTIPPFDLDADETQVHFKALRELRESLGGKAALPHLSMGMSHDFREAILEGATYVRVGTAIFGERAPKFY